MLNLITIIVNYLKLRSFIATCNRKRIKEKVIFSSKSDIITVPKWRYQDIDTLEDWKRAEIIAKTIY